jgi:CubicO group peptidase (beta-lactamase class C family)
MQALKRHLFAALVLVIATRFAAAGELPTAKPADVGLDADKIQQARDAVQALIDKKEMAGAVIAVARKGKVVMFEALGEAETGSGKPMKTDSIVRIYSMTLQFSSPPGTLLALPAPQENPDVPATNPSPLCPHFRRQPA